MHPQGRFLYISDRGHDSIACFAIDAKSVVNSVGPTANRTDPRSFNLDPSGNFLYVSGQGNGKLTAYRIDQTTGLLHQGATYHVGEKPMWVMVLTVGK